MWGQQNQEWIYDIKILIQILLINSQIINIVCTLDFLFCFVYALGIRKSKIVDGIKGSPTCAGASPNNLEL